MIPFYLVLTVRIKISCFSNLFIFRDLPDIERAQSFCHVTFFVHRRTGEEEVNGGCHEAKDRSHHMVKKLAYMVGSSSHLVGPIDANFGSMDSSQPKTELYTPFLMRFCDSVVEKYKIHQTDLQTTRI
jgi:hypothetical protein